MNELSPAPRKQKRASAHAARKGLALRLAVHLVGLLPLAQMVSFWAADRLTANPIQFVEQRMGQAALHLLVASLAVTPLITLTGWRALSKHSRTLGLYSFGYFTLHFLTFVGLDYGFDLGEIVRQIGEKPFILVGLAAGLILLALAVTSYDYWKKLLRKNWKRLHRLVYLAGVLAILHYALAVKGSLATLGGNIRGPLLWGALVLALLILRIPPIRRWASTLRTRFPSARGS